MRLHDILYGIAICLVLIGVAGIDGWMFNGTSLFVPVALVIAGILLWFIAGREDRCTRKK